MVVILLGPPGVGKGTQALQLAESLHCAHVSTGDLLRAARRDRTQIGARAQSFMDAGELVPDKLILDLVSEHLGTIDLHKHVLFDGFPRTTEQAVGLRNVLKDADRSVDMVVLFEAPNETLVKRLSGRRSCPDCGSVYNTHYGPPDLQGTCDRCGGGLVHREDDKSETVQRRLQVYQEQTAPLISFYEGDKAPLARVQADRDVEEVYADFQAAVEVHT